MEFFWERRFRERYRNEKTRIVRTLVWRLQAGVSASSQPPVDETAKSARPAEPVEGFAPPAEEPAAAAATETPSDVAVAEAGAVAVEAEELPSEPKSDLPPEPEPEPEVPAEAASPVEAPCEADVAPPLETIEQSTGTGEIEIVAPVAAEPARQEAPAPGKAGSSG